MSMKSLGREESQKTFQSHTLRGQTPDPVLFTSVPAELYWRTE